MRPSGNKDCSLVYVGYAYAINKERPAGWSVKPDDFFPYAHGPHRYLLVMYPYENPETGP